MKLKRSQEKRITREAKVLRFMRQSRGLSLNQAGAKVRVSGSAIAHIEQGRMDVSRERAKTLVAAYGYGLEEYLDFLTHTEVPMNFLDDCMSLLRQLSEEKLKTVHAVLLSMAPSHRPKGDAR